VTTAHHARAKSIGGIVRPLRVGPWSLSWPDLVVLPVLVALIAGVTWAAFRLVGFLGLGILGLLVGLIASNLELAGGKSVSGPAANLYADAVAAEARMTPAERAARRAERARAALPLHVVKVVSAGLVILGFGLFFAVQLRGG
jgi:hypothetical protein